MDTGCVILRCGTYEYSVPNAQTFYGYQNAIGNAIMDFSPVLAGFIWVSGDDWQRTFGYQVQSGNGCMGIIGTMAYLCREVCVRRTRAFHKHLDLQDQIQV